MNCSPCYSFLVVNWIIFKKMNERKAKRFDFTSGRISTFLIVSPRRLVVRCSADSSMELGGVGRGHLDPPMRRSASFDWSNEQGRRKSARRRTRKINSSWQFVLGFTSLTFDWFFAEASRKVHRQRRANSCPAWRPTTRSSSKSILLPTRINGSWL